MRANSRESERERAAEQPAPALSSRLHCSFPLSSLLSPLSFPLSSKTAGYAGKTGKDQNNTLDLNTVEPRFNEPLYNKVLGITNDFLQPGQNYSKMCGTEPRFNEILVVTNTIHEPKRKICLDITNKCHHVIKINVKQTNKDKIYVYSSFKQFCLPVLEFLVP